jgi:rod shape-determining protein MreC
VRQKITKLVRSWLLPPLVIAIILWYPPMRIVFCDLAHSAAYYVVQPTLVLLNKTIIPIKRFVQERTLSKQNAQQARFYKALSDELQAELIQNNNKKLVAEQTESLRTFYANHKQQSALLARILLVTQTHHEHSMIISLGRKQGITDNMPVIYKNCLLGRVEQAYPNHARVLLVTDRRCKVGAICCATQTPGIYRGTNTQLGQLDFVSHLHHVKIGDQVITSGRSTIFPQGLLLGTIKECVRGDLKQEVSIEVAQSIHNIDYCFVIPSITQN